MDILRITKTWDGQAARPDEHVEIRVEDAGDALRLTVDAPFHDDPVPPGPPGPHEGLWDFEVVELFIAGGGAADAVPYTEIELSPHGHHLVLRLEGVRRAVERGLALNFIATIDGDRWHGTALVPRSYLPIPPWTANAYALHGTGKNRRYLAMIPVPGEKPDFHRPDVFQPVLP